MRGSGGGGGGGGGGGEECGFCGGGDLVVRPFGVGGVRAGSGDVCDLDRAPGPGLLFARRGGMERSDGVGDGTDGLVLVLHTNEDEESRTVPLALTVIHSRSVGA